MHSSGLSPEQALHLLREGNLRFTSGQVEHIHQSLQTRAEVLNGQHPFAAVLSCADSRVPVEILFDQGIGDVFVMRNAGNVVDDVVLGSIEYAVEHLGVRLVVVLGHSACGAVTAALQGGEAEGHLGSILDQIAPAVESTRHENGDALDNAIRANVRRMVDLVCASEPILSAAVEAGSLQVVGGIYTLATGKVEFLL